MRAHVGQKTAYDVTGAIGTLVDSAPMTRSTVRISLYDGHGTGSSAGTRVEVSHVTSPHNRLHKGGRIYQAS